MPYVAPNAFAPATSLDATAIQGNDDALKSYINGNIVAGDVSPTTWVRAPHIMRGTYIPLSNTHEFTTGLVRGGTYDTNNITVSADRFRTPYPAFLSNNGNFVVEFIPEESVFTYHFKWQTFPKHIPFLNVGTTTVGQICETTLGADYGAYTCHELDAGQYRNDLTFQTGTPGFYRRRAVNNWKIVRVVGATPGVVNRLTIFIGTNVVVNDFAEMNYSLEVYYG